MKFNIKKLNDPILRASTEEVADFGMETQSFIDDMIETMRKSDGIGLAAPQVGNRKKIIVCEYQAEENSKIKSFPLTILCNPGIVSSSKECVSMVEGCLSFPGLEIIVKRPKEVTVSGLDRSGKPIEIKADGLFSRVLQHEIDHLNSTLLIDHIKKVNVVFIGTGTLGGPALEALATDPQYNIKLVVTGDNKTISREHKKSTNPIEQIAGKYKLEILKTKNINEQSVTDRLKETKCELAVMADFGQIISKKILELYKYGIINIHPSLLPRHRGPSPVQQTILDGDKITGVSLILTSEKMDSGKIISQASVELRGTETATILKDYLAGVGASLLLNSIPYYITKDLKPFDQDEAGATYNKQFKKEDGEVDEKTPKEVVDRKIRAFSIWPKVYTTIKGKRILLIAGHFEKDGSYLLDRVKPEGKNEMTYEDYKRGYRSELTFY